MELAQTSTVEGAGPPNDQVVLHPFLYPHSLLKLPLNANRNSLKKQLGKLIVGSEKQAQGFIASLEQARSALETALESTSVSDAAVAEAVTSYLGLLAGLVMASPATSTSGTTQAAATEGAAAAAGPAATPDDALAAAEGGAVASAAGASWLAAPMSRLRHAVQWQWGEAALAPPAGAQPCRSAASDALYELASVLVGAAIRLMHAAAQASADSPSGVPTSASTRSYRLLREAAGMLELVARDVLPLLPGGISADCDPQVVGALSSVALADAQQLTVLRAIQKGNQPGLIAALAVDTAALYGRISSQLGTSGTAGASSGKLWHYSQYKQAYCLAHAHIFNGIVLWKADKPGEGLRSLKEAETQLAAAKRASGAFDAAPPASLNLHHRRVDEDVEWLLNDTQRRMKRENDAVFLQRMAADVPPLPAGKRLVSPLPYVLPPPAAAVTEGVVETCFSPGPPTKAAPMGAPAAQVMQSGGGTAADGAAASAAAAAAVAEGGGGGGAGGSHSGEEQGCSCCRWLAAIIAFPVLAVLWFLGAVIWVLFLPLKCCCPCIGLPLQWAVDLALWLLKLPARLLLWASGKVDGASGGGGDKK